MRDPTSGILTILAMALSLAAGTRWYQGAVAAPDRLDVGGGPALLLVLRGDDCPDRRGGLERWLSSLGPPSPLPSPGAPGDRPHPEGGREGPLLGLDLVVVHLSPSNGLSTWEPGEGLTHRFRSVDAESGRRASRALRRAGVPGTPAFLLLDGNGRVLLGEEITEEGPGPRLALAGRVIQGLLPLPVTEGRHRGQGDDGCLESAWGEDGSCAEGEAWSS